MSIEIGLLAVIAVSVAVMAIAQMMAALKLAQAADRLTRMADEFRRDVAPVLQSAREAAQLAAEAATMVKAQHERLDAFVRRTTGRIDDVLGTVHGLVVGPISTGATIVAGIRALWDALSASRRTPPDTEHDADGI